MISSEDDSDDSVEWYFHEALEKKDLAERERWLQESLGHDPDKLKRVKQLIAAFESSSYLERTPDVVRESRRLIEDMRDKRLGPFILGEMIGSGGMGDVYLAQQIEPIKRLVALKLIQRDAEHQQIVERFQREKQMLASMEHPNIARIIDAGTDESDISYIAMEYVKGVDILEYCRKGSLMSNPELN
jgi:hypothetical protein